MSDLTIVSAFYDSLDVKSILENLLLSSGSLDITVSNDLFTDPSPGGIKKLKLEIIFSSENHILELPEGLICTIPDDLEDLQNKIDLMYVSREEFIKRLNLTGIGIEIGVQQGRFSKFILDNSNLHLIVLDAWRYFETGYPEGGNVSDKQHLIYLNETLSTLQTNHEGRFTLIRELSQVAHTFFKDEMFDFMYLDSNHTYSFVFRELENWWPKLKIGGVMAGHDFVDRDEAFGVKSAVTNFFREKNMKVNLCDSGCCPTWFIKKI
jgi:hypothetical protein